MHQRSLLAALVLAVMCGHAPSSAQGQGLSRPATPAGLAPASPRSWEALFPGLPRPGWVGALAAALGEAPQVVHAPNARFEAREPLDLPPLLVKPLERMGAFDPGWFLVHLSSPPTRADRVFLDAVGGATRGRDGRPRARWYLPNRTFSVFVRDAEALASLLGWERAVSLRRYEPAFKLSAAIGSVPLSSPERRLDPRLWLNVDVMPGHSAALLTAELQALGAELLGEIHVPTDGPHAAEFLVVAALPGALVDIAWLEGVRFVQEAGDGPLLSDLSMAGKLQARSLAVDEGSPGGIVNATDFPLWLQRGLHGQGQLIGVVDTLLDFNNTVHAGSDCEGGSSFPDDDIQNFGFADPLSPKLAAPGAGGVSLKVPRVDLFSGAAVTSELGVGPSASCSQAENDAVHGSQVCAAAAADFYGGELTRLWEHDPDSFLCGPLTSFHGVLGPGLAHEAQLYFTPVFDSAQEFAWNAAGVFESNMGATLSGMASADCSSSVHSTGIVEANDEYSALSVVHDTAAFDHPFMLAVMAAGNEGAGPGNLSSQGVVKNALSVGASEDVLRAEARASFSSTGPRFDGARKPDILTPGCDTFLRQAGNPQSFSLLVLPTSNGSGDQGSCMVTFRCGTSFSAPLAAGAAALVHQWFEEGNAPAILDPSAAMLKAMLVHSAVRLTGANLGTNKLYPSRFQGWGEPSLDALLFPPAPAQLSVHDAPGSGLEPFGAASDPGWFFPLEVPAGASAPLSVTLCWTDEPGSAGQGRQLVNDLDLFVRGPGSGELFLGNAFDTVAGVSTTDSQRDALNNLERVIVPAPSEGSWIVGVQPREGSFAAPQGFALVLSGELLEGPALQPGVPSLALASGFAAAPKVQANADGSLDELLFAGFALAADDSEDARLSGFSLQVQKAGAEAFGPLRLFADDDLDGLPDDMASPLLASAVVGQSVAFEGLDLALDAGSTRALVVSIGIQASAGAGASTAIGARLFPGLPPARALLLGLSLGLLLCLARARRPGLRLASAAGVLALASLFSAAACGGGGGGGDGSQNFDFILDPSSLALEGQTTAQSLQVTGAPLSFRLKVLPPPSIP